MIHLCPFCGHVLPHNLKDGIASCLNCSRVFDSTPFNRLLSAGWMVRKEHIYSAERLVSYGFTQEEALLAITFVFENCYSHEEYVKALKNLGVSQVYVPPDAEEAA